VSQSPATDPETMLHIRRVRDTLSLRLLQDPDVSLVDIGLDPETQDPGTVVVRVHLRRADARDRLEIPVEVDGVAVRVITATYHLE
jgi:hypothetical protein